MEEIDGSQVKKNPRQIGTAGHGLTTMSCFFTLNPVL